MSHYPLNWLRTTSWLIVAAISIASFIPRPLDAKGMGLEPAWEGLEGSRQTAIAGEGAQLVE
jgi:hypothetical protein